MPKKFDKCVKAVKKTLVGKRKFYINKQGKKVKSSAYAICNARRRKK